MQIITLTRRTGMTLMLDLLKQLDPDRTGDVVLTLPESARLERQNLMFRRPLNAIGHGECLCDDDDALCPACLAKGMLEPMPAGRVAEVFQVPLGAVPYVAGAGGRILDNDDDD